MNMECDNEKEARENLLKLGKWVIKNKSYIANDDYIKSIELKFKAVTNYEFIVTRIILNQLLTSNYWIDEYDDIVFFIPLKEFMEMANIHTIDMGESVLSECGRVLMNTSVNIKIGNINGDFRLFNLMKYRDKALYLESTVRVE